MPKFYRVMIDYVGDNLFPLFLTGVLVVFLGVLGCGVVDQIMQTNAQNRASHKLLGSPQKPSTIYIDNGKMWHQHRTVIRDTGSIMIDGVEKAFVSTDDFSAFVVQMDDEYRRKVMTHEYEKGKPIDLRCCDQKCIEMK